MCLHILGMPSSEAPNWDSLYMSVVVKHQICLQYYHQNSQFLNAFKQVATVQYRYLQLCILLHEINATANLRIALQSGNKNPQKTNVDSVKVGDKSAENGQAGPWSDWFQSLVAISGIPVL